MPFTTRKSLLAKVKAGDEVSWAEFYAAYKPLILLCGQDCMLTDVAEWTTVPAEEQGENNSRLQRLKNKNIGG